MLSFNPIMVDNYAANRFSHYYHLGESIVNFRGVRSEFDFLFHFFDEIPPSKQNSPMGRRVLRRHIWGYVVCLCPIKGTPGLNELMARQWVGSQTL